MLIFNLIKNYYYIKKGYTGMLRTICMMDNFGPNAPPYRQPKRIFIQHFMYQNNGDFIRK